MRRLVAVLAACAVVFAACELTLPNGDPAGVFPVGTGVHQLSTGLHQPEVVVDQSVYPDGTGPFAGVQFKINGVVDARDSLARPNGVDATGPNEPGSGRFHIYPSYNFQACDTVVARWFHGGVEWGATAQVPGAACGTTTTTTAAPTTTTSPPTTTQPPVGGSYFEDFNDGDGLAGLEVHVDHRDSFVVTETQWGGEHALLGAGDCTGPDQTHTVTRASMEAGAVYVCDSINGNPNAGHLMTAMGDTSGYSIVSVLPDQTFADVTEVRWSSNITNLGNRQWLEVKVLPAGSFDIDNPPCAVDWLSGVCGNTGIPAGGVAALFFQGNHRINTSGSMTTWAYQDWDYPWRNPGDPARTSTMIRRDQFFRDNGDGTLSYGIEGPDGQFDVFTAPGAFPAGQVRVVFADHNYTPNKDESGGLAACRASLGATRCNTWHWDDLTVLTG